MGAQPEEYTVTKFTIEIDGQEEPATVQVEGNEDNIFMSIPEGTKYTSTIHFKAHKELKDFKYIQIAKKAGVTIKKTEKFLGDFSPREEPYSVTFPPDETPSGFFVRGQTAMKSSYYVSGELIHEADWIIEVTKK